MAREALAKLGFGWPPVIAGSSYRSSWRRLQSSSRSCLRRRHALDEMLGDISPLLKAIPIPEGPPAARCFAKRPTHRCVQVDILVRNDASLALAPGAAPTGLVDPTPCAMG